MRERERQREVGGCETRELTRIDGKKLINCVREKEWGPVTAQGHAVSPKRYPSSILNSNPTLTKKMPRPTPLLPFLHYFHLFKREILTFQQQQQMDQIPRKQI